LLLIAIGFFLSWIPLIGVIGGLLELIGAIMVILGRKAFGPKHARNVFWSIIIFVVGVVAVIITLIIAIFFTALSFASGPPPPGGTSLFGGTYIAVGLVEAAVIGFVYVLFTYELQQRNGRLLLWCGYIAYIAAQIINYVITISANGSLASLLDDLLIEALISMVPVVLFGVAYILARQRIARGEIPSPMQPLV